MGNVTNLKLYGPEQVQILGSKNQQCFASAIYPNYFLSMQIIYCSVSRLLISVVMDLASKGWNDIHGLHGLFMFCRITMHRVGIAHWQLAVADR